MDLEDKDLHLTNINNLISSKNIVSRYLKEKDSDVFENLFDFKKSVKILANIENKINMFIENYKPKTHVEKEVKKRVLSTLNKIRYTCLFFFQIPLLFLISIKKYQRNKIDRMLNKYSENSNSVDEIIDQVEILRNVNKSPPEEFIAAESIKKTKSWKIKKIKTIKIKNSTMNQNTNSKQTID